MKLKWGKIIASSFAALLCACAGNPNEIENANLQTLVDAAAKSPEKTLTLKDKTYLLSEPLKLGNEHSGLKIVAENQATISGGKRVENWERDGKLLKAKIDGNTPIFSLFVNDKRANIARYPDGDNFLWTISPNIKPLDEKESSTRAQRRSAIMRNEDIAELLKLSPEQLKTVYFDFYLAWYSPRVQVDKIVPRPDGKTSVVAFNDKLEGKFTPLFRFSQNPHYQIINAKFALSEAGEFFFDQADRTLYYYPRAGETAENIDAWYPLVGSIVDAKGENFKNPINQILFKNIKFQYGRHIAEHANNNWSSATQAASYIPGFLTFSNARGVNFENCTITHCDTYGIAFYKSVWDSSIKNCEFVDVGAGGIRVGGRDISKVFDQSDDITSGRITIENNIVYNYGRWNKAGVGIIIFDSPDNVIKNNTIFDGYYSGISVGWNWGTSRTHSQGNKVLYNRISNIGYGVMDDMGGIYVLGINPNSLVKGNVISEARRHNYGAWGLYNDANSSEFLWEDNYVFDTDDGGYYKNFGVNNILRNNIFVNGKYELFGEASKFDNSLTVERNIIVYADPARLLRYDRFIPTKQILFKNNIYWNTAGEPKFGKLSFKEWQEKGQDAGSFVIDPKLNWAYANPVFEKIGFKPFDVKLAGVKGDMQKRLDEIVQNYKFPQVSKCPKAPPFSLESSLNLDEYKLGDTPKEALTNREHINRVDPKAINVMEENGKRFLRMYDKPQNPSYYPYLKISPSIANANAVVSFKLRANKNSKMYFDVRGTNMAFGVAPAMTFRADKVLVGGKTYTIPLEKWIDIKYQIQAGKNAKCEIKFSVSDGATIIAQGVLPYKNEPLETLNFVSFQLNGNDVSHIDLADIKVDAEKK